MGGRDLAAPTSLAMEEEWAVCDVIAHDPIRKLGADSRICSCSSAT